MSGGHASEPVVSIVTASFNMGRFLDETITSVLEQDYPRVEYLVMDGRSPPAPLLFELRASRYRRPRWGTEWSIRRLSFHLDSADWASETGSSDAGNPAPPAGANSIDGP